MRVLWLSHLIPYPPKAGVLLRSYNMVRELARHHEVDLLAFHQHDLLAPIFSDVAKGVDEARKVLGQHCGRLEFFPTPVDQVWRGKERTALKSLLAGSAYNIDWLRSSTFAATLRQWVADGEYDLVHFDTISLMPYLPLVGNVPTMLDHHNIESHMLWRRAENEPRRLLRWYFRREAAKLEMYEREQCSAVNLNITCSDVDSNRLREIVPDTPVVTVPNGVDVEYFRKGTIEQVSGRLIFVGTLSWYPNAEAVRFIANEVWPLLMEQLPDTSVDIIGANPPAELEKLAAQNPRFRVLGFVDDIRPNMDQAEIYVCPITDGGGTKLKVLDAFAMGKAVIANPVACEGIDVEDGETVCFAETAQQFVDAILALRGDDGRRALMGEKARKLAEDRYAYRAIGDYLASLVEACVDGRTALKPSTTASLATTE